MNKLSEIVLSKIEEYNIQVNTDNEIDNDNHVFVTESMIVFVNSKEKSLAFSFYATAIPEVVANYVLILKEIKEIKSFHVMESFIHDEHGNFVAGEKAFEIARAGSKNKIVEDVYKQNMYKGILEHAKCFTC
jgi:hypothetical protein